jgi:hypothetical protein
MVPSLHQVWTGLLLVVVVVAPGWLGTGRPWWQQFWRNGIRGCNHRQLLLLRIVQQELLAVFLVTGAVVSVDDHHMRGVTWMSGVMVSKLLPERQ